MDSHRYFYKNIFLSNLRTLLKESNVKIGQIEKAAGCAPGYVSRLEKKDNPSDPSVQLVCAAAGYLGVSIDAMVKNEMGPVTPSENQLIRFLSKLIDDTAIEKIEWHTSNQKDLRNVGFDASTEMVDHPLFDIVKEVGISGYPEPVGTEYKSRFKEKVKMEPLGFSYSAHLPYAEEKIYVMSMSPKDNLKQQCIEVYLYEYELSSICDNDSGNKTIDLLVERLYMEIQKATSGTQLSRHSKNVIERYLNEEYEDLPF